MRLGEMTNAMIRSAALAAALSAFALAAPAADAQQTRAAATQRANVELTGAERNAAVAQANRALNSTQRLQGRFVQIAPDGSRATGTLYMQRPGKLRFEYDPPATLLIISDGSVVSMRDTALRNTERTNLRSTPLNLILRTQVDLARDARITGVGRNGDWIIVEARDRSGMTDGEITMFFRGPNAELRAWDIVDATGARTRITLSDVTRPAGFNQALFRLEDQLPSRRPGRP
jgi:outer membrane lipoprotein-sorting protein